MNEYSDAFLDRIYRMEINPVHPVNPVQNKYSDMLLYIKPIAGKTIRQKPRNKDETDGLYDLMRSKIDMNISTGKTQWIGNREMERKL